MNREQALQRAIELKEHSQEFEAVSFIDDDTEFFEYVIKELERTAQEVPVQEQSIKFDSLPKINAERIIITGYK